MNPSVTPRQALAGLVDDSLILDLSEEDDGILGKISFDVRSA